MDLESIFSRCKDFLFPVFCLNCQKEGTLLCQDCISKFEFTGEYFCPVCHKKTQGGMPCVFCSSNTFLSSHVAIFPYHEGNNISQLIHEWKYNWVEDAEIAIKIFIEKFFEDKTGSVPDHFSRIEIIVPVPLHKKRQAERGFNQAEKIAAILAKILQKPVQNILVRDKYTEQQAKLGKNERQKNVTDAFSLIKDKAKFSLEGKNILIVDDVLTTSATLNECAKILKNAGAGELHGFSLARG